MRKEQKLTPKDNPSKSPLIRGDFKGFPPDKGGLRGVGGAFWGKFLFWDNSIRG